MNTTMTRTPIHRRRPALALALAAILAGALPQAASAAGDQLTIASSAYGATRNVSLALNKSMIVDLPAGVAEVIVSQPDIAAAIMRTRTRAILQGVSSGDTNVFFLDDNGRTIQVLDLSVTEEPSQVGNALEAALARVIPGSRIKVESVTLGGETNRVVLTGTVLSSQDRDRAMAVATQFAGSAENVASIIDVTGAQQVMLQVTVSEVKRDVAKQFGINLGASFSVGTTTLNFGSNPTAVADLPNSGIAAGFNVGSVGITAALRALEARGALRMLAQPNLTAISGESAKFMAGGELPYYTYEDDGSGNTHRTVLFKPYGVELNFTPVVKSNGTITLNVHTSVSEPQSDASLTKREADTSVELPSGTTLAIGGLLQETSRQQINQMPVLGNIPILGALFRSRDFQTEQTELVILVTPYLVSPSPANTVAVPTDYAVPASDAEAIFLGAMERRYGVGANGDMRGGFSGSVGFVLD